MALKRQLGMNPKLEIELRERKHSLGAHPIFPDGDEVNFEEKLIKKRFEDVFNKYKSAFRTGDTDLQNVVKTMQTLLPETIQIEVKHKKVLEDLAIEMVKKEFDIADDDMEIIGELTTNIVNVDSIRKSPLPNSETKLEFKDHNEIKAVSKEVEKRRFINAMIQGSAKKCNHMFHLVDEELNKIDYRLLDNYSKIMAMADFSYYIFDDALMNQPGGIVEIKLPRVDGEKISIHAKAMTLPVLIHELIKGVMEVISVHGLPKNPKVAEFVMGKADYMYAEHWDMRLGSCLWERFTAMIEPIDFHLKHHIYCDLIELPVEEFNDKMREIMGGTLKGKKVINDIVSNIKEDIKRDDLEDALYNLEGDDDIDLTDFDFSKFK